MNWHVLFDAVIVLGILLFLRKWVLEEVDRWHQQQRAHERIAEASAKAVAELNSIEFRRGETRDVDGARVTEYEPVQAAWPHCTCPLYPAVVRDDCPRHKGRKMDPPHLEDPDYGF